jgi:hypothetical protein
LPSVNSPLKPLTQNNDNNGEDDALLGQGFSQSPSGLKPTGFPLKSDEIHIPSSTPEYSNVLVGNPFQRQYFEEYDDAISVLSYTESIASVFLQILLHRQQQETRQ